MRGPPILIDEARTPLIISGQGTKSTDLYKRADDFVKGLTKKADFEIEEKDEQILLTDKGKSLKFVSGKYAF